MRPLAWLSLAVLAAGCGTGGVPDNAVPAPAYDPDRFADAVLAEFDANKNGSVDGAELTACPALRKSAGEIDGNHDDKISRDELKQRAEKYTAAGSTAPAISVVVNYDGSPLEGAVVTFTPEKCMGEAFKPASGTTDASGLVTPKLTGTEAAGVPCGLYRVTVSKQEGGKEKLPARYNAKSTLGHEVVIGGRASGDSVTLELSSR